MSAPEREFSFDARRRALERLQNETFDLLVIGGGITGAAAARDAATRGLKVALVEKADFASGTSSGSSKLIHGGLRYLENYEFALVFESLSERAKLLRNAPHMVRPLPFYMPVFADDRAGPGLLSAGLWLYDLLALFRAGVHRRLSRVRIAQELPMIRKEGLRTVFRYYDASMWDDMLTIETLRAAAADGAVIANYVEGLEPLLEGERVAGFRAIDRAGFDEAPSFNVRARQVVVCAGPWTDKVGVRLDRNWRSWLTPSKGVHLIFDLERLPVPGAVTMIHPSDGRVAFIIPRTDFGAGVAIVGTTDSPPPDRPEDADVSRDDETYLLDLLARFFPALQLTADDVIASYVGIRPLFAPSVGQEEEGKKLQKISREHHIGRGPGGTVVVAGGKYTTHRKMAEEIVDYTLGVWREDAAAGKVAPPESVRAPLTDVILNPRTAPDAVQRARSEAAQAGETIPERIWEFYGAGAREILTLDREARSTQAIPGDPDGFPLLAGQLRYLLRHGMVVHLEDFYFRRLPLFLSRRDHCLPWAPALARVWAADTGRSEQDAQVEQERVAAEIARRAAWTDQAAGKPDVTAAAAPAATVKD